MLAVVLVVPAVVGAVGAGFGDAGEMGGDVTVRPQPRGSILIEGDEDFEQPTAISGVRSGSGTTDDPYVISNWTIIKTRGFGIRVEDTTAHFEIRNVRVTGGYDDATAPPNCLVSSGSPFCGISKGIWMQNLENGSIRNARVGAGITGIDVARSEGVEIDTVHVDRGPSNDVGFGLFRGLRVFDSTDVVVRNATIREADNRLVLDESKEVLVEHSSIPRGSDVDPVADPQSQFQDLENTTIRHNVFEVRVALYGTHENTTHAENTYTSPPDGPMTDGVDLGRGLDHRMSDSLFCGNRFERNAGNAALWINPGSDIHVVANRFVDNLEAFELSNLDAYVVRGNLVQDNYHGFKLDLDSTDVEDGQFHGNWIANNSEGSYLYTGANWSHNWWGDASGPNITGEDGPGTGDRLNLSDDPDQPAILEPWLEEPPELDFDCIPGEERGAQREVHLSQRVTAHASARVGPVDARADAAVEGGTLP